MGVKVSVGGLRENEAGASQAPAICSVGEGRPRPAGPFAATLRMLYAPTGSLAQDQAAAPKVVIGI